jgi:hypothetical protein
LLFRVDHVPYGGVVTASLTASPRQLSLVDGMWRRTYSTAGMADGEVVFGRGSSLQVALTSATAVELLSLEVIGARSGDYPPHLRYDKIQVHVGRSRLPLEQPPHHVLLQEPDTDRRPVPVQGLRGVLPSGTHTWTLTAEAAVSGLWTCEIRARLRGGDVTAGQFLILLRGR